MHQKIAAFFGLGQRLQKKSNKFINAFQIIIELSFSSVIYLVALVSFINNFLGVASI